LQRSAVLRQLQDNQATLALDVRKLARAKAVLNRVRPLHFRQALAASSDGNATVNYEIGYRRASSCIERQGSKPFSAV
jgi:hypothetical protein